MIFRRSSGRNRLLIPSILSLAVLLGCSQNKSADPEAPVGSQQGRIQDDSSPYAAYPVVDGLHVTGQPVEIDIETYRLTVTGAVAKALSLSYDQILAMESQRAFVRLVCPGFFTDEGYWTGVPISDLLDLAGIKEGATRVSFISADGSYSAQMSLEEIGGEAMLVAYAFQDRPLPTVHGYPLRIVAKDQPGNRWVKWLAEIVVK